VALEVFIQETLALPFRRALNQIKPQSVLVDLFEGVCVESQFSCTLQDFFFVIATYFAAAFCFVVTGLCLY